MSRSGSRPKPCGIRVFTSSTIPGYGRLGVFGLHEVEVAVALLPRQVGDHPAVDVVRAGDDPASRRLPEDLGQPHDRNGVRGDHVGQYLPGSHRRQLVGVADDQQGGRFGHGVEQRAHQHDVDHRGLVDDQQVAVQRIFGVALEAAGGRVHIEQPVDGAGLHSGGLGHPPRGAARRRAQPQVDAPGGEDAEDGVDQTIVPSVSSSSSAVRIASRGASSSSAASACSSSVGSPQWSFFAASSRA